MNMDFYESNAAKEKDFCLCLRELNAVTMIHLYENSS